LPDATILVMMHVPDRASADILAKTLIDRRLAACVNIGAPVESMYHWRGQTETGTEIPVAIKTRSTLYSDIEAAIRSVHPYELPEVIAVPIVYGHRDYLDWIAAETRAP